MTEKNEAAQSLGRLGGMARARALTPEQRAESARRAVEARILKYNQKRRKTDTKSHSDSEQTDTK